MKKNWYLRLCLVSAILLTSFTAKSEAAQSGSCGGECTWTLDNNGVFRASNSSTATGEFKIPEGTKIIANSTLEGASGITKLTIPKGVTTIENYAFNRLSGVTGELKIPDSVTTIGTFVFHGMSRVTSIIIPDSVTSIGSYAFRNMNSLSDIFLSADSKLSNNMLENAAIDLNKIVRYTSDGKYLKDGKTYASMEDYKEGSYAIYDATGRTYQKFSADGEMIGKFNHDGSLFAPKRIYTVSEAEAALGTTGKNTFSIRYR